MQGDARLPRRRLAEGAAEDHPRLRRRQADQGPARARSCRRSISQRRRRSWPTRSTASRATMDVLSLPDVPAGLPRLREAPAQYDNTSVLPTPAFFYGLQSGEEITVEIEPGKTLIIKYLTTGEPRDDGTRTVFFELNGQPREVVRRRPLARRQRCTSIPRPTPTTPTTSPPRCRARCRTSP